MSTAAAVAAASALYNGNLLSALLAAGQMSEFTYKPPPEWLGEKKGTQLRKHADCCVRMDCTTHAIYSVLKTAGDNMKELWNKAVPATGSGADEQRLLLCAPASQVTVGPLECSDSGDCWFFSIDCGSRPLYLLWLSDERDVAAEALHASLSAFIEGATAHATAASLVASGHSPEACSTVELIKNLCWQQSSHMLFPMWHAVCKGNLPESCQPDDEDESGLRAAHVAAARSKLPMLTQLKQMGCDLDATDFKGRTPLAIACMAGLVQVIRHLLLCGATATGALWVDASPLFVAVAEGRVCLNDANRIPVFTALVLEREGSAAQEKSGMSFLQLCCSMGSLFAVRLLLDKKRENPLERRDSIGGGGRGFGGDRSAGSATCDVNAFSSNKHTALHIATRHRYMEIVKVLLQNGANSNALTGDGCSALELCLQPAIPPPLAAAAVAHSSTGGGDGSPGPKSDASLASVIASHGGRIIRRGKTLSLSDCNVSDDVSEAIFAGSQAWASASPLPLPPNVASTLASVAMVPDDASSCCLVCSAQFSVFNRRHHCRVCGQLLCDACSSKRVSRPPTASLERCCDSCFNKIRTRLPQSLSHSVGPSPPPPQSVLVESSPVAPPSFDQWQQQQQHPSDQSAAVEKNFLSDEMARKRAEDEFTNDLREAQREVERGGVRGGMANDVVRDTRDALIRRGNQLQSAADRSQRLQNAAQGFAENAARLRKQQVTIAIMTMMMMTIKQHLLAENYMPNYIICMKLTCHRQEKNSSWFG